MSRHDQAKREGIPFWCILDFMDNSSRQDVPLVHAYHITTPLYIVISHLAKPTKAACVEGLNCAYSVIHDTLKPTKVGRYHGREALCQGLQAMHRRLNWYVPTD